MLGGGGWDGEGGAVEAAGSGLESEVAEGRDGCRDRKLICARGVGIEGRESWPGWACFGFVVRPRTRLKEN